MTHTLFQVISYLKVELDPVAGVMFSQGTWWLKHKGRRMDSCQIRASSWCRWSRLFLSTL